MKEQISELYSEYGRYINKYRAFPLIYDGLKIVERRLLYSLYEKAKDHFVKSAEVIGHTIGRYHPHGDSSAYGSLVQLVSGGMAMGQGNWGSSTGIVENEAAAMRYTEVRAGSNILDMAFEYIKYIKLEPLEIYPEPIFLPTKLPLCLMNKNICQGIGFGSRTVIPSYKVSDLVKRLRWLLGYDKDEPIIKPLTDCIFISKDEDFKQLLTTGKAKIEYRGITEIDYQNKGVVVKAVPPSKSFQKILKNLENAIQIQKTIGVIDESTTVTRVKFVSLKRTLTLADLQKKINIHLIGSQSFECNMCDQNGNVVLVSVDQMLLNVYNNYKNVVDYVLKTDILKLEKDIAELILIGKIKTVLPKWLRSNPDDSDIVVSGVATDIQIDKDVVSKIFDKYTISRILKIKTDIETLQAKKNELQINLNSLESFIWDSKYKELI